MATVNYRTKKPQAFVINGVDAGGAMSAAIQEGYDVILKSPPDGLQLPVVDREIQFCRGTIVTQDWIEAINLLTGTLGTLVFYERKSGADETGGYIKHTITAPVIYSFALNFTKGGYAVCSFNFECRAADPTKTIADMHAMTDTQNAPTYVSAARGGFRIETAAHGAVSIYHLTSFSFSITMNLARACNDADIAYTCVDAELDAMNANGNIVFQDSLIASAKLKSQQLLLAVAASLVLVVTQSQGAADKTITIAKVVFTTSAGGSEAGKEFTDYNLSFELANDPTAPLTLTGVNKILTIA